MEAAGRQAPLAVEVEPGGSRLLGLLADERLVARVRAGSERAFAVLYERHHAKILSFCRHMLGSHADAEDALQQTFANAYRDIVRDHKQLNFRPWLFRIARNQCISMLRSRRPLSELRENEPSVVGLSQEVAGRTELRDLLEDLAALPEDQREALLLAELHGNSHAEVARIIGCEREKVKSLVFQARRSLAGSRRAREIPCEEIQRRLSVLTGGALRRGVIRRHLKLCPGCRAFQAEVRRQRQALAIVLPVIPSSVLELGAANAIAAGTAAAGAAAGAGGAATGAGPLVALAGKLGVSTVALKGAAAAVAVTVAAGGGAVAVESVREPAAPRSAPQRQLDQRTAAPADRLPAPGERAPGVLDQGARKRARGDRHGLSRGVRPAGATRRDAAKRAGRAPAAERGRPQRTRPNRGRRVRPLRSERRGAVGKPPRRRPARDKPVRTLPRTRMPAPPAVTTPKQPAVEAGTTGPVP